MTISQEELENALKGIQKNASATESWKKNISDVSDELGDVLDSMKKIGQEAKKLHLNKSLSTPDLIKMNKELVNLEEEIKNIDKTTKAGFPFEEEGLRRQLDRVVELTKKVKDLEKEMDIAKNKANAVADFKSGKMASNVFKHLASNGSDLAKTAGEGAKSMAKWGLSFTKFAGPAAIIGDVAQSMWDLGMASDSFIKNANKAFASFRGPDIMTTNIKKQFKEFNDQIYMAGQNIRVGLNAEEIRGFMEALSQSGYRITQLNNGLGTYRDAIYKAAKASKTLGLPLTQVGAIMGDLMTNFRMDLDRIDDTFVQLSFDASKSGLTTDTFFRAVENASASLSLYGNFINKTSKAMSDFTKTGVMGANETAQAVADLNQSFAKMNTQQKATFIGLIQSTAGGAEALRGFAKEQENAFREQAKGLQVKIEASRGDKDTFDKLKNQQAALLQKADMANKLQGSNAVDMATYLPVISDKTAALLSYMVKARVGGWVGVSERNNYLMEEIAGTMNVSKDLIMKLGNIAKATDIKFKTSMGLQGDDTDSIIKALSNNADKVANSTTDSDADFIRSVESTLNEGQKDQFKQMIALDKNGVLTKVLRKSLKEATVNGKVDTSLLKSQVAAGWESADLANNYVDQNQKSLQTAEEMKSKVKDQFKQLVKQTLSFKEMQDIAGDEVNWRANSLNFLQGINSAAFGILKHLTGGDPEQKAAEKNLGIKASQTPAYAGYVKGGKITEEGIKVIAKDVAKLPELTAALADATEKGDEKTTKALEEQIKSIQSVQETLIKTAPETAELQNYLKTATDAIKEGGGKTEAEDFLNRLDTLSKETGKSVNELISKAGISSNDFSTMFKTAGTTPAGMYDSSDVPRPTFTGPKFATLNKPHIVTAPGPVRLDEGESILPKEYSKFRAIPAMGNFGPAGNTPGGPSKGINITFNANGLTSAELGQKVLNEIRSALYNQKLTGMA